MAAQGDMVGCGSKPRKKLGAVNPHTQEWVQFPPVSLTKGSNRCGHRKDEEEL